MVGGVPGPSAPLLVWGLRQLHERVESLVGDLTDEQLAWSPALGAHSLGLTLWHIPRCDDNYLRQHIQGRTEVWQEEEWFRRWGLDQQSTGMLLSDEEAGDLRFPGKDEVLAYARRVWSEVTSFVEGLAPTDLQQPVSQVERTAGMTIGQVVVTHIYGHDSRHLGEMEYIKGLLGLQGSVTL